MPRSVFAIFRKEAWRENVVLFSKGWSELDPSKFSLCQILTRLNTKKQCKPKLLYLWQEPITYDSWWLWFNSVDKTKFPSANQKCHPWKGDTCGLVTSFSFVPPILVLDSDDQTSWEFSCCLIFLNLICHKRKPLLFCSGKNCQKTQSTRSTI